MGQGTGCSGALEGFEGLGQVCVGGGDAGNHEGAAVPPQGAFQQRCQVMLAVLVVRTASAGCQQSHHLVDGYRVIFQGLRYSGSSVL